MIIDDLRSVSAVWEGVWCPWTLSDRVSSRRLIARESLPFLPSPPTAHVLSGVSVYPVTSNQSCGVASPGTGGTTGPAQSHGARGQVRRQRRGETPGCPTQEAVRDGLQVPVQPRSHGQRQPARHGQGQDGGVPHLQELSQVSVSCGDHNNNSQSGYRGEHLVILY